MRIIYSKTTFKNAVVRSLISILTGIALILWADIALKSIVMFIGALFLISGLVAFINSYRQSKQLENANGYFSFNGFGSILLGLVLVCAPLFFTAVLMIILGCILMFGALAQLALLSAARQFGRISVVNYIFPVLILIAGIIVVFKPWGSAEYIVTIFGITAIVYGITDLISQYQFNKLRQRYEEEHQQRVMEETGQIIEDTDYEEVEEVE